MATGRVQLPVSIILPIYLASGDDITRLVFGLIYTAIYFGYIISPVHPCLIVTCEYFGIPVKAMIVRLAVPTASFTAIRASSPVLSSGSITWRPCCWAPMSQTTTRF